MSRILVSGMIGIETTLKVEGFPIAYAPARFPFFGVNSSVSGVGYNLARALTRLGNEVRLLSLIGQDIAAQQVRAALQADGLPGEDVVGQLALTAQSVIAYDPTGKRAIFTDLKDVQEQVFPVERFEAALAGCDLAALCNINFSRPFLAAAKKAGIPIATDVHTISSLDDDYNRDFMQAATILFMSDERLPAPPEAWARQVLARFPVQILVIGLGSQGALMALRKEHTFTRLPALRTRPVVNTIGAGDALFSSFLHSYLQSGDAHLALRKAMVFASYKIGATSAADGLLDAPGLEALYQGVYETG